MQTPMTPRVEALENKLELLTMTVQRIEADARARLFVLEEKLKSKTKKEPKFEIGDRVKVVYLNSDSKFHGINLNDTGKVIGLDHGLIAVRLDRKIDGHSAGGSCDAPHGWFFTKYDLEHIQG